MDDSRSATTSIEELLRHDEWLRGLVGQLVRDPGTADDVVQQRRDAVDLGVGGHVLRRFYDHQRSASAATRLTSRK